MRCLYSVRKKTGQNIRTDWSEPNHTGGTGGSTQYLQKGTISSVEVKDSSWLTFSCSGYFFCPLLLLLFNIFAKKHLWSSSVRLRLNAMDYSHHSLFPVSHVTRPSPHADVTDSALSEFLIIPIILFQRNVADWVTRNVWQLKLSVWQKNHSSSGEHSAPQCGPKLKTFWPLTSAAFVWQFSSLFLVQV